MKRDYIHKGNFNLFNNTANVLSKIAEFEVAEYSVIETRTDEPFNLFLAYREEFTAVDVSTATASVTATGDIPNTPQIPDDGGKVVGYVSTDGGTTWTRAPVSGLNYWSAGTNPNQVTLDTSAFSSSSATVAIYYLFMDGNVVIQASPPKGEYETVTSLIGTYPVGRLHRRSQFDDEIAPYFAKQRKYPGDWNLYVKLDSSATFNSDAQDLITKIEFPVTFYESGESVPKGQLEDELVNEILKSRR